MAVAVPLRLLWEATAFAAWCLLGPSHTGLVAALWPRSPLQAAVAGRRLCRGGPEPGLSVAATACPLRQSALAVLLLAPVFGDGYQGLKSMAVISALGVLCGALAFWRRSLRPSMIARAGPTSGTAG